jgi:type II secretory pathway pseudopilin PulG
MFKQPFKMSAIGNALILWGPIIVGMIAAIAVPFYTGYVERARVTETSGIMGAIITSQKEKKKRTASFYSVPLAGGVTDIVAFRAKGIDVSDREFFTYQTAATGVKPNDGFMVTATSTAAFGNAGGTITYNYDPTATPPGSWAADGAIILDDMLPTSR